MEKIWLKNYQPGVPAELPEIEYHSLIDLYENAFNHYAELPAFTNLGTTISYTELDELSAKFAGYLQQQLKVVRGDRVAIMLPNLLQYPIAMIGIMRAGAAVVNVNPMYTSAELAHQLSDCQAKVIIVVENFAHILSKIIGETKVEHVITTSIGELCAFPKSMLIDFTLKYLKFMVPRFKFKHSSSFSQALAIGAGKQLVKPELTNTDMAFLQYTGGTTGVPKGAVLTHKNMLANVTQASLWLKPNLVEGCEIIITALPMYHIFSLTANCLTFMCYGALNVLITNPRDINGFIKILKKYKFTALTGVNTLFNGLVNNPKLKQVDFSKLKIALGGGMAVQNIVAEKWHRITGHPIIEAYGLSETSPAVCINPINLHKYNGTIGLPVSSTMISIRTDNGQELAIGEAGELWVKGPQVMQGYWQKPEETANVMQDDWFKTGDIAIINNDGFVKIVDRKKDMILVSGFKVFPNEIEDVLAAIPGVLEAAVIGIKLDGFNEEVKAFIVKARAANITAEEIIEHCRANLTGYKIPKHIEFIGKLPKNNVGKILRKDLRDLKK
jgi:long-chain acyl-CoA synthetase